jgi:hypothetical protein
LRSLLSEHLLRRLLPKDLSLLRLRLWLLSLLPSSASTATTRRRTALLSLLSRRAAVRITASVPFSLAINVRIQTDSQ